MNQTINAPKHDNIFSPDSRSVPELVVEHSRDPPCGGAPAPGRDAGRVDAAVADEVDGAVQVEDGDVVDEATALVPGKDKIFRQC